jgi:hypothetical protein
MQERDLKPKYIEMKQQLERIHALQITAKYVGLSGTKHIIFGLWLITQGILTPQKQKQVEVQECPMTSALRLKLQTTCQAVLQQS